MKILFLTHYPHLEYAKSINAGLKLIPLEWFVRLEKLALVERKDIFVRKRRR